MPTEREKMLSGAPYDPADPELVGLRARARRLTRALDATDDEAARRAVLRELFAAGGDTVTVEPPFRCDYGGHVVLGERVYLNFDCVVLDVCTVTIGRFTLLGPGVHVYTALHPLDAPTRRRVEYGRPVTIGADVWIGGRAVVLPGVTVGDRAVIGAGSVVTRDVPAGVLAAGNPCRVIRALDG
jgi:maltose O-acetyltransferase